MKSTKFRNPTIFILAIVFAAVSAGAIFAMGDKNYVPEEFSIARAEGSKIAAEIVTFAKITLENLEVIAANDQAGEAAQALILISDEIKRNRDAQTKAIALASQLEKMAVMVPAIEPSSARFLATEGLTAEIALVSRLLTYNNQMYALFGILQRKLTSPEGKGFDSAIAEFVKSINEQARAINGLNDKFISSLAEIDKILAK